MVLLWRHGCEQGACPACAGPSSKGKEPAWEGSSGHGQQPNSRGSRHTEVAPRPQRKGWDWAADGASQPLHLLASRQRPSRVGPGASEGSSKGHGAKQQRGAPGELQHGRLTSKAGLSASHSFVNGCQPQLCECNRSGASAVLRCCRQGGRIASDVRGTEAT